MDKIVLKHSRTRFRPVACLLLLIAAAKPVPAEPGNPMHVADMAGRTHDIEEILEEGRAVALIFWQTWCASCKREAPEAAKAARKYGHAIRFFGVVSGSDEYVDDDKVRSFVEKVGLPYPQVRDRELSITEYFQVKGTPTVIVLGKGMEILYRGHRLPDDWTAFDLKTSSRVASGHASTGR